MATAKLSETYSAVSGKTGEYIGTATNFLKSGSTTAMIILVLLVTIVIVFVIETCLKTYKNISKYTGGNPWILHGTKNAKRRMLVLQDPSKYGSIQLPRSDNEKNGIEFTYAFWMYIDDWSYKYGSWKHILHKGSPDSWPNRCPGVWLHPTENKMRV